MSDVSSPRDVGPLQRVQVRGVVQVEWRIGELHDSPARRGTLVAGIPAGGIPFYMQHCKVVESPSGMAIKYLNDSVYTAHRVPGI